MWNMLWPILITVSANTLYNICAKSTPSEVNAFASLSVTYLIAAVCSLLLFFATGAQKNLLTELTKTNWSTFALGISIVGLEFGYICIYRAGWKVSVGNLVASITLACVLVLVGALLYREVITLRQIAGMAVCMAGLALLAK